MNIQVENVEQSVQVSFEPGFNNYAPIQEYDVEFAVINSQNEKEQEPYKKIKTVEHTGEQLSKQVTIGTFFIIARMSLFMVALNSILRKKILFSQKIVTFI